MINTVLFTSPAKFKIQSYSNHSITILRRLVYQRVLQLFWQIMGSNVWMRSMYDGAFYCFTKHRLQHLPSKAILSIPLPRGHSMYGGCPKFHRCCGYPRVLYLRGSGAPSSRFLLPQIWTKTSCFMSKSWQHSSRWHWYHSNEWLQSWYVNFFGKTKLSKVFLMI